MHLDREQLLEFGRNGYLVVREVVPRNTIDAAMRAIDDLIAKNRPPDDTRGPFFYWRNGDELGVFESALLETPAFSIAQSLVLPLRLQKPVQAQISLNIPPFNHRPGGPHIDGFNGGERDAVPGTFTMLAGIFLTDESRTNTGNLWVWPGSHLILQNQVRERGTDAFLASKGYPPIELPEPRVVLGNPGDLLLSHYMLGHNIGGNMSSIIRRMVYYRLRCEGHRERWSECVTDALLEYEPVRRAMELADLHCG